MKKENIFGISIVAEDKGNIIKILESSVQDGKKKQILVCANPHSIVESLKDDEFLAALQSSDIVLPDGIGIVFASRILGKKIDKRISGPDVFVEFTEFLNTQNRRYRYFFLGSTNEVLERIKERIKQLFSNIEIVGTYSPPFEKLSIQENERIVKIINEARPDVLWVGMSAPKQEKWIYKNKEKLNVPLIGAVGAAFDFFAGAKKRAPNWIQRLHLEWLFRFVYEPKRLWRRVFVSIPLFLFLIFKERFKNNQT